MNKFLIAFGSVPKDGGTFTFYRNLRAGLLEHGIDLRCVSVGRQEADLWDDAYVDEGCVLLAANETSRKRQARIFVDWCQQAGVDIVMAVNSVAMLSALAHLPANIRVLSRCANAFDHGYRITMSCHERLQRIVALAPGQIDALVDRYGAKRERIVLIPNGTDHARFAEAAAMTRGEAPEIRLGFMGRLEHKQKGVLFLPDIIRCLCENGVRFSLDIAGKGVHEAILRRELQTMLPEGQVRFRGALAPGAIADFLAGVDVYLFPSQFEGSPNALIEAKMAGCVPAAWHLPGITDFLVDDGSTGLSAELGECAALADKITGLYHDRTRLRQLAKQSLTDTRQRFSRARVVADYARLVDAVMTEPPLAWQPKHWSKFSVDPAFAQPLWKKLIPEVAKAPARKLLYQLRLSNRFE